MAEQTRINELAIKKTTANPDDLVVIDTPIQNQGETYKMSIKDFAAVLQGGSVTGDMLQSVYDQDHDGIVNAAHQLQIGTDAYVRKSIDDVILRSLAGIVNIHTILGDIYLTANAGAGTIYHNSSPALNVKGHITDVANPHNITKSIIGLDNVDNTADEAKPVSGPTAYELLSYVTRDGSQAMNPSYTPGYDHSVATKKYVDSKVQETTTIYTALLVTDMYDISNIKVGDKCIVTDDGANTGEYTCIVANATAPSSATNWQLAPTASGDLKSDGTIPMQAAYDPTPATKDIATAEYAEAQLALANAYTDAEAATLDAKIDANAAEIDLLKVQYETFTWVISGTIASKAISIPMFLVIPTNEDWVISKARFVCGAGNSEFTLRQDATSIANYSLLDITTTATSQTGDSAALINDAKLDIEFDDTYNSFGDVTVTIQIKKTRNET